MSDGDSKHQTLDLPPRTLEKLKFFWCSCCSLVVFQRHRWPGLDLTVAIYPRSLAAGTNHPSKLVPGSVSVFWGIKKILLETTGTLCFGLTLPMGFKARVDVVILRVNSESNVEFISCSRILLCSRHHPDSNQRCMFWKSLFRSQSLLSVILCRSEKIVGNLFQPIGGFITGKCIHQGFRREVIEDVISQIYYIWFPRILWYARAFHPFVSSQCPCRDRCVRWDWMLIWGLGFWEG